MDAAIAWSYLTACSTRFNLAFSLDHHHPFQRPGHRTAKWTARYRLHVRAYHVFLARRGARYLSSKESAICCSGLEPPYAPSAPGIAQRVRETSGGTIFLRERETMRQSCSEQRHKNDPNLEAP
eukprot:3892195-Rhodomonas_salina.4